MLSDDCEPNSGDDHFTFIMRHSLQFVEFHMEACESKVTFLVETCSTVNVIKKGKLREGCYYLRP